MTFRLTLLACVAVAGVAGSPRAMEARPQVNSNAPKLINLPAPQQRTAGRSTYEVGPLRRKTFRCYTQVSPPKGCVYQEAHEVNEDCVCSLDGGEVPGRFME